KQRAAGPILVEMIFLEIAAAALNCTMPRPLPAKPPGLHVAPNLPRLHARATGRVLSSPVEAQSFHKSAVRVLAAGGPQGQSPTSQPLSETTAPVDQTLSRDRLEI